MWPFQERTRFPYRIVPSGDAHPSPRINKLREEGLSTSDLLQPTFSLLFYQIISLVLLIFCIFEGSALAFVSTKYIRTNHIWTGGPVSTIPYTFRNFTRNLSMANLTSSHDVEDAWSEYETIAFVHIPDPERYSLLPNKDVEPGTENIYMFSAHHQLHCLKQVQLAFVNLAHSYHHKADEEKKGEMFGVEVRHVEHCFDYLRQGIVCAGDATLEGPDPGGRSLSGYGTVHRCRAWDGPGGLDNWRKLHRFTAEAGRS